MTQFKSRKEAADYLTALGLPITRNTLEVLACKGGGPSYSLWGNRAVYTDESLHSWVEQKLSPPRKHTSQA